MDINYTKQELTEMVTKYKSKYGSKILWDTILNNVRYFQANRETILKDKQLQWHVFLYYLANIESTIGLYDYDSKGPFHRIFVMFGRAYLEEKEVINTEEGRQINLAWIDQLNKYFKSGDGKAGDIDLQDENGLTYDVKNDYVIFKKAHGADFILKYRSKDGYVELHKKPTRANEGSFVSMFTEARPLADIAISLGLDPLLFDKNSSEDDIKRYLGLID